MATTAQAATSGCSSIAASMSSGWILSPAAVTITSLLRPRNRSSPDSCRSAMSPVASHSSCARTQRAASPGGAGDHRAAHQHFAVGSELDFASGQRLADGALGHVEGMVERDERGGLGHAVALHEDESERVPELLQRARQRAAAGDEGPELEAELAMNGTEAPPAPPRADLLRAGDALGKAGVARLQDGS